MSKIQWNKVTWYSKLIAVILFLAVFAWAFYLGEQYGKLYQIQPISVSNPITETTIANATFKCDAGKTIQAQFMQNTVGQGSVALNLSDGRALILPQAISADGARYAKPDESFVFWNVGNGAFIEEGAPYATTTPKTTYANCSIGNPRILLSRAS